MKLLQTKLLAFIVFIAVFVLSSGGASANTAAVKGKIVNKDTGEGINKVVVRWNDTNGGVRYAETNSAGEYYFAKFGDEVNRPKGAYQSDRIVDTNYDNVPDAPEWSVKELTGGEKADGFGCSQNPHSFSALKPPHLPGTFENASVDGIFTPEFDINNGGWVETLPTVYYVEPTTPPCPSNIRHSCNPTNATATVTWDQPQGGATGYRMYIDQAPFGQPGTGDRLHDSTNNQLSRTFNISLNTDYLVRVRTVRNDKESESCLMQFKCECPNGNCGGSPPPTPSGPPPQPPTASLLWCANPTDSHYLYTISNINTYGLPFVDSKLMVTFNLNAQTQFILNYLTNSSNSSTADFSLWNERNRQKQTGDYFGFYIQSFSSLNGSTLPYQITANTRIGQRTMGEFRQFLADNNLPLTYNIKANMGTRNGSTILFNSHIPAPSKLDLSKDFSALCADCPDGLCPPPGECPVITITQPAQNEVLTPVNNRVTVEWTATGATALTQYEVMIYDKTAYASPQAAYQAYQVGVAVPIAMPTNLIVYTTTGNSQVVNFGDIDSLNPENWMIAIRSTGLDPQGQACAWVSREPAPPGFPVSGRIYEYNPSCQPLVEVPIGGTITVSPNNQSIPVTSGIFNSSLPQTGSSYALRLTLDDEAYTCANICGQGPSCVRDNITPANNTINYFVREEDIFTKSWWQVFGGFAFAQNVMNSELPITDENQSWRLMAELIPGINRTAGIPVTNRDRFGNNAPDNTNVAGWLREPPLQAASAQVNEIIKPDFSYYRERLDLPDTRLPADITQISQLNGQNRQGVVVHYREGDLKFAPDATWSVSGKQHHVVLVQGNITISAENLPSGENRVVATGLGSTTTFVASGTITIAGNVGNSNLDSLAPNLSGIFIANQIIIQDDGDPNVEDKRFVGEGSFIAWSNLTTAFLMQRHFDDFEINKATPSEAFVARPDFVISLPEVLRDTDITWKEVN